MIKCKYCLKQLEKEQFYHSKCREEIIKFNLSNNFIDWKTTCIICARPSSSDCDCYESCGSAERGLCWHCYHICYHITTKMGNEDLLEEISEIYCKLDPTLINTFPDFY